MTHDGAVSSGNRQAWTATSCLLVSCILVAVSLNAPASAAPRDQEATGDGTPHALFGFVFDPFGEKLSTVAQVTLRNNRTGGTVTTSTDPSATDYSYRFNDIGGFALAGDRLTLTTATGDLSARNWTVTVLTYPYQQCDLWLWGPETSGSIRVHAGWNLVSLPFLARTRSLPAVLSGGDCRWSKVMRYDSSIGGGRWVSYDVSAPAFMNSLHELWPGEGIWLYVTDPASGTIPVEGLLLETLDIGLLKGWNLAGYPSLSTQSVASSLVGVSYDLVQNYSATSAYNLRTMLETNPLTSGGAYWIHASSDCVWSVFNPGGVSATVANGVSASPGESPMASAQSSNGTAVVYARQDCAGIAFPAQLNAPAMNVTVWNGDAAADELEYLRFTYAGTDPSDVAAAKLWLDADANLRVSGGDTLLGSGAVIAGSASFPLSLVLPPLARTELLLAFDASPSATPGDAVDFTIQAGDAILRDGGSSLSSLDPAGQVTLAAALSTPHPVYGYVYDAASSPMGNATVTVMNDRTGQALTNDTDADGRYAVDLSWLPGGYLIGDGITVEASDGAMLAGENATVVTDSFGDRCDIWTTLGGQVEDAPYIRIIKAAGQLNVSWAPVANATGYRVYRSLSVDGNGFDWNASVAEVSTCYFVDAGALADSQNYSYVVRGFSPQGEGPKSNIGWKLRMRIVNNVATSDLNWIALPYETSLATALDLIADLGGSSKVTSVARWDVATQSPQTRFPLLGVNFALVPGEGLLVNAKATFIYTTVGSYNASVRLDIVNNPTTSDLNWIALPYHTSLSVATDLIADLGGSAKVTSVARWDVATQSPQTRFPLLGTNFAIKPGEAHLANMKLTVIDYDMGPVTDP